VDQASSVGAEGRRANPLKLLLPRNLANTNNLEPPICQHELCWVLVSLSILFDPQQVGRLRDIWTLLRAVCQTFPLL
jgi:hypothetical protein